MTLSLPPDHPHQSSDRLLVPALTAIAKEQVVPQPGAETAVVYPILAHAASDQLPDVGQIQIEVAFSVRPRVRDQLFGVIESVFELDEHLLPDLENCGAYARAERGMQVLWARVVLLLHALDCSCDDASERAAPSGVYRRESAGAFIGDQNRQAIGRLNRQQDARRVGCQRVTRRRLGSGVFQPADETNVGRMDLPCGDQRPIRRVQRAEETAVIFYHVLALVLAEIPQAERVRRQRADAPEARAEGVFEADPLNRVADQQPQVVDVTKREMLHLESQISDLGPQVSL